MRCDYFESSRLARGHLGGNLERVIRTAVRPVLVVSRIYKPITRFLIAYDGGPSVNKAIDFVRARPLLKGATCHILRVGHLDDKAKYYFEEAAGKLRVDGYEVTTETVLGEPESAIATAVKNEDIQLLVMGAYGHSPIRALILGSTTTTMVRTCPVPILMFH